MNKTIKKLMVALLACVAICGTTMAAPAKGGAKPPAHPGQHQQAKAPAKHKQQAKAPAKPAPKHHEAKCPPPPAPVVCVQPAPPPPAPVVCVQPPPPARTVIIEEHHDTNPLAVLGCAIVGGIIGAIAG